MGALVLTLLLAVPEAVTVRPPRGFHALDLSAHAGTRLGQLSRGTRATGRLDRGWTDGAGDDASVLLMRVEEEPWRPSPRARDEGAAAVARHLREDLGLQFQLERAELKGDRLEVTGTMREGAAERRLLVVIHEGSPRHVVLWASAPVARWDAVRPLLAEATEDVVLRQPAPAQGRAATGLGVAVLLCAGLALAVLWLAQRRRRSGA